MANFQHFKIHMMNFTGLERDALHIYVGIAAFLISLLVTRPLFKRHITRLNMALLVSIVCALAGEYLDLKVYYPNLTGDHLRASIHDIINTSFWPIVLYIVNRWTSLFNKY